MPRPKLTKRQKAMKESWAKRKALKANFPQQIITSAGSAINIDMSKLPYSEPTIQERHILLIKENQALRDQNNIFRNKLHHVTMLSKAIKHTADVIFNMATLE